MLEIIIRITIRRVVSMRLNLEILFKCILNITIISVTCLYRLYQFSKTIYRRLFSASRKAVVTENGKLSLTAFNDIVRTNCFDAAQ